MNIFKIWLAGLASILVAACNPMANMEASESRIAQFQQSYSEGNHDRLYRMTGSKFREVTSREEFQDLLDLLDARLGPVVESERSGFNINTNNGLTVTVISMQSQFEQGSGSERYTFHGHGDEIELVGWSVDSPRLALTKEDLAKINAADESEAQPAE